jgi:hypothetical protein
MSKVSELFDSFIANIIAFFARYILRNTHLFNLHMLPIGASLSEAEDLYGEPNETEKDDEDPSKDIYTFDMFFHRIRATFKENRAIRVSYWTNEKDARPDEDLAYVLESYSDGYEWTDLTPGYSAVRKDGRRRADFSAVPAICVSEVDFPKVRETWNTD